MTEILNVFTTIDSRDGAEALARRAVTDGRAACVQIEEIASVYLWEGAVQEDREFRLLFKVPARGYDALAALILAAHPYDEPALWALPVERGSESFLKWVDESCAAG
ncbi:divalent cation tolerance protein [Roseivivax lentus]|uniref:Divalent cation tolerance protein n=1 Tax=Roseivivax lentus TaxID=633194 RepID=A0A1N7L250_9RHOB|nr:divalent-cation tolerance protein CutA [Roseivivax lentus]SIS67935.1 divalent cation tolerance protein [Roseivivax lentus]